MKRLSLFLLIPVLFLGSCSVTKFVGYYVSTGDGKSGELKGNTYRSEDTSYTIGTLPGGWERVKVKGGDLVFQNAGLNSTITINSDCDGKKVKYNLPVLSESLLIGINEKELEGREQAVVDGESALYSIYTGSFDNVPIKIATLVFKKGTCIYDFTYASSPDNFDTGYRDFRAFTSQFRVL